MTLVLKWLGLVFAVAGALLTSLNYFPYNIYCFNLGSLLYFSWACRIRDLNMMLVNGSMLVIYFFGLIKEFL